MKILLIDNQEIFISDIDYERVIEYEWRRLPDGYVVTTIKYCLVKLHRFILQMNKYDLRLIDHKDLDRNNYQRENLRPCSYSQNFQNSPKKKLVDGTSIYKGVNWRKQRGHWITRITLNYHSVFIYSSDIEIECAYAYNVAALHLFKSFALINEDILLEENKKKEIEKVVLERLQDKLNK